MPVRPLSLAFVLAALCAACSGSAAPSGDVAAPAEPTAEPSPSGEATSSAASGTSAPVEAQVVDSRTVVFPAGLDLAGDGALTSRGPTDAEVAAALSSISAAPELDWVGGHARFVSARVDDGVTSIVVTFACDVTFENPGQALDEMQRVSAVGGGGDCYGFAVFDTDGNLLRSGTNGES